MKDRDIAVLLEDIDDKLKTGLEFGSMIPAIDQRLKSVEERLKSVEENVVAMRHAVKDQTNELHLHDHRLTRLEGQT